MDRRAPGAFLLATAVVLVVAVPRLLNPLTVAGAAAAEPPPPPPAVGSCLAGGVTSSWGARGVLRPADTVYVSCDRPHRAEIFLVIDPLPSSTSETVFDLCTREVDPSVYLGVGDSDVGWRPELQVRVTASGPDARQVAAGQNWAACVLVDDVGGPLTTPLAGSATAHTIPAQVGACFDGSAEDLAYRGNSPCDAPHGGELFASRTVDGTTDLAELTASCRTLVGADTGHPALIDDPSLVVEAVVSRDVVADGVILDTSAGPSPAGLTGTARCVLLAVDGRELTASLRGLGTAAVPWAD